MPLRAKKPLYPFPITHIIRRDQRHGFAAVLRTCSTSDTMDIILGVVRHIIVNHQRYIGHINSAGHHVGRHQHTYLTVPEIKHHLVTFMLLEVAMHRMRINM